MIIYILAEVPSTIKTYGSGYIHLIGKHHPYDIIYRQITVKEWLLLLKENLDSVIQFLIYIPLIGTIAEALHRRKLH